MNRKIRKLLVSGMAAAAVLTAVAGCSAETARTEQTILTPAETAATSEETEASEQEITDYKFIPIDMIRHDNKEMVWKTSERDLEDYYTNRGYYVYAMKNSDYPYLIVISMGEQDTDGYRIEVVDIMYDGSEMIITVRETYPDDDADVNEETDYPGCQVDLSRYPDSLKIVNEDGDEFPLKYSNVIRAVGDWYAVFEQKDEHATYATFVTRTEDGRYRYINVCELPTYTGITIQNVFGEFETGIADTKEEIVKIAEEYGSCGTVTFRNDPFEQYTADDFLANKDI